MCYCVIGDAAIQGGKSKSPLMGARQGRRARLSMQHIHATDLIVAITDCRVSVLRKPNIASDRSGLDHAFTQGQGYECTRIDIMAIINSDWFDEIFSEFHIVSKKPSVEEKSGAQTERQNIVTNTPDYAAADETGAVPLYTKTR